MTNLEQFLAELTELTKKHRIQIMGCGCCGSPCLNEVHSDEEVLVNMKYVVTGDAENLTFTNEP